jgi:hypothetical protein
MPGFEEVEMCSLMAVVEVNAAVAEDKCYPAVD